MVLKYSKLITVTGAITRKPVTILVESIEAERRRFVSIMTLEGTYDSAQDFEASIDTTIDGLERGDKEVKMWTLRSFMLPEAELLAEALQQAAHAR